MAVITAESYPITTGGATTTPGDLKARARNRKAAGVAVYCAFALSSPAIAMQRELLAGFSLFLAPFK